MENVSRSPFGTFTLPSLPLEGYQNGSRETGKRAIYFFRERDTLFFHRNFSSRHVVHKNWLMHAIRYFMVTHCLFIYILLYFYLNFYLYIYVIYMYYRYVYMCVYMYTYIFMIDILIWTRRSCEKYLLFRISMCTFICTSR